MLHSKCKNEIDILSIKRIKSLSVNIIIIVFAYHLLILQEERHDIIKKEKHGQVVSPQFTLIFIVYFSLSNVCPFVIVRFNICLYSCISFSAIFPKFYLPQCYLFSVECI